MIYRTKIYIQWITDDGVVMEREFRDEQQGIQWADKNLEGYFKLIRREVLHGSQAV